MANPNPHPPITHKTHGYGDVARLRIASMAHTTANIAVWRTADLRSAARPSIVMFFSSLFTASYFML